MGHTLVAHHMCGVHVSAPLNRVALEPRRYKNAFIITHTCMKIVSVVKLLIFLFQFDFVNSFLSLFYVAFYLQDMKLLRSVSVHSTI